MEKNQRLYCKKKEILQGANTFTHANQDNLKGMPHLSLSQATEIFGCRAPVIDSGQGNALKSPSSLQPPWIKKGDSMTS